MRNRLVGRLSAVVVAGAVVAHAPAAADAPGPPKTVIVVSPGASLHGTLPSGKSNETFLSYTLGPGIKGLVTIEVRSLDFDAAVDVSLVEGDGSLSVLGSDDDGGIGTDTRFLLKTEAKESYRIAVRATNDDWGGEFDLVVRAERTALVEGPARVEADETYLKSVLSRAEATRNSPRKARILSWWAVKLTEQERYDEALAAAESAAQVLGTRLGEETDATVSNWMLRGRILKAKGAKAEARQTLDRAFALTEKLHGGVLADLAGALCWYGDALSDLGDTAAARAAYERALELAQRPDAGPVAKGVPFLWGRLGFIADDLDDAKAGERAYRASVEASEKILGPNAPRTGTSYFALALFYKRQGRYAEAENAALRDLQIDEARGRDGRVSVVFVLSHLAEIYIDQNRSRDAEAALKRAIEICDQEMAHLDVWRYQSLFGKVLGLLGSMYSDLGRFREAQPLLERAVAITKTPDDPDRLFWNDLSKSVDASQRADRMENLAILYHLQSKEHEAEPLHRRVLDMRQKTFAPDHPAVARSLGNLGSTLDRLGQTDEAVPFLERALKLQEERYGTDSPRIATQLVRLGAAYRHQGHADKAEVVLRGALAIREKSMPGTDAHSTALNDLAIVVSNRHQYQEADMLYERALAISEKVNGTEHPETATILLNLGIDQVEMKRYAQGEALELRALKIRRKVFGRSSADVGNVLHQMGMLYWHDGRYAKAERFLRDGLAMEEATLGADHPDTGNCRKNLVSFLKERHRDAEAAALEARLASTP